MTPRFLPEAVEDIRQAVDFYETRQPGLGAQFADEVAKTIRDICQNPTAFSPDRKQTRRSHTRRFHHTIVYLIEGEELWIVSAAHSSRDPDRWFDRL